MKYYIYVSDAKTDMLYNQIAVPTRNRLATELKIDLKILSASFSEKEREVTRFSKLKLVVDYIEKNEQIGTVDEPSMFFRGTMPLRWGKYTESSVYFGGVTNKTVLGLVGSIGHVIGSVTTDVNLSLSSSGHEILFGLYMYGDPGPMDGRDLGMIARATKNIKGIKQSLEFMAIRLVEGYEGYLLYQHEEKPKKVILPSESKTVFTSPSRPFEKERLMKVVLGSPIYVALVE